MRQKVYVSGPLSSSGNRLDNVQRAIDAGVELIKLGYAPLVPHLTHYMDPTDSLGHDPWIEVDIPWVSCADAVLRLPGDSTGADAECYTAKQCGIPIYYSIADLDATLKLVASVQSSRTARLQPHSPALAAASTGRMQPRHA